MITCIGWMFVLIIVSCIVFGAIAFAVLAYKWHKDESGKDY